MGDGWSCCLWWVVSLILALAWFEKIVGRTLWGPRNEPGFWTSESTHGTAHDQYFLDPYSFTHVTHGILLYAGLWSTGVLRKWGVCYALVLSVFIECLWEALENSVVIEFFQQFEEYEEYTGDSIMNSCGDVLCSIIGFLLAAFTAPLLSILYIVASELLLYICIHDNFALILWRMFHLQN